MYILPAHDRVTVVISTRFEEEADRIFGKVFLQEFVDARRQPGARRHHRSGQQRAVPVVAAGANHVFKLPDVGEGTAEAELVGWHVKVGDAVQEDQILAEVMTDKATVELTSPVSGVVVTTTASAAFR